MTWALGTDGTVVYLALEDGPLTRRRLHELADPSPDIAFVFKLSRWPGAFEEIRALLEEHRPALLVVDSLRCLSSRTRRQDYAALAKLHEHAVDQGTAVLAVYHDVKRPPRGLVAVVGFVDRIGPTPSEPPTPRLPVFGGRFMTPWG